MKRYFFSGVIFALFLISVSCKKTEAPAAYGPVPTENQMRWQEMEYYAFIHFSLNTYTDQSWGFGNEDVALFNPTELDARQWARICKEAGMKGIIVTAKHHCGFCLWPSAYTEYSVKNAPWKDGKGDVIRELADACKEYGLKLGIYLSPWDRNHADYGKPEYITYFRNQLTELLTNYGDIFEVWYDGANGGTGYYGGANENRKIDRTTYYDWKNTYKLVRELQPNIVIWNDGGDRADLRWVGTEGGWIGETNWSLLNATGDVPFEMLHYGVENGDSWVPGEVNTSIRPEWFYHPSEDTKVKTLPQLMDTWYYSVGRNATFLLNFPIMPNGLIHPNDEKAALDLAAAVKEAFAVNLVKNAKAEPSNFRGNSRKFDAAKAIDETTDTYWATDEEVKTASLTIDFGKPTTFNRFMAQEYIRRGQRVKAFTIEAEVNGNWQELAKATTIGYKRILRFPTVTATKLRFSITDSKACPVISNVGVYNAPQILTQPTIIRNQAGEVSIIPADVESEIYYTLDGSEATKESEKYNGPILTEGKVKISAISVEPSSGKSSAATVEDFGLPRKEWKIVGIEDEKAYRILDGNLATAWRHGDETKLPVDLVIDLGAALTLRGFKYYPEQNSWQPSTITHYEFFISADGKNWKLVSEGEFSNIKNNPLWQTKNFEAVPARYIKFRALKNTENNTRIGYAEIDVITALDLKLYTIKGQVKLNVERPTPTSACLSLSNKSIDKRTCTRERGTFVIDSVNAGLYSLQVNGYGSKNIDTLIEIKGTSKIIELELLVQCEINSSVAKFDIKNSKPRLLVNGGIAPAYIPNKDLFEKKYGVKYDDMGDVPPPHECLKQYNTEVFKYLDSKFGESWKAEISSEVVGFEKSK